MDRTRRALALALVLLGAVGCERGLEPGSAARAGDLRLEVEDAASFLAPISALPNDPAVAQSTLEIWIDYALLAWAVNREGELATLDLSDILDLELTRRLVGRLREQVILADTAITNEELEAAFELERPGEEVRASHILFSAEAGAPESRRDSLRAFAEEIRERAIAGEDFARLAEAFSDDPGSAVEGGDLGFFGRGVMVPAFEEAAFALEPGEIGEVVESEFGLHVIRLEERRLPGLSEVAAQYRTQLQTERVMVAESIYLAELEGPANVQVADGAIALVRRVTAAPGQRLSGADEAAALTTWAGGEFGAEEYRLFIAAQPAEVRQQITSAPDAQIEIFLHDLARDRLLVNAAEELGIELSEDDRQEVLDEILGQYRMVANLLGVDSLEVQEGGTLRGTVEEQVAELMRGVVANERDLIPLGSLAPPLRRHYGYQVADDAAARIVAQVAELRAQEGAPSPPGAAQPSSEPPASVEDTEPPPP